MADNLDAVRRQRHGLRSALGDLERAVAAPSTGRAKEWAANVSDRTGDLREAFIHHVVVTEGDKGLFDEVLREAPRLANQVNRLREDHVTISDALTLLVERKSPGDSPIEVEGIRDAVLEVMGRVVKHRHLGSSLLYEAYFVDIDAAD